MARGNQTCKILEKIRRQITEANDKALAIVMIFIGMIGMSAYVNSENKEVNTEFENKIYTAVEQLPEFPGGPAAMMKFICANLKYPKEMVDDFQGRVVVKFYVDTLGHVCAPEIVKGRDSVLDREALRVVGLFPDFIPAQHLGKKVNAWFTLPISFKFSDYADYCD